MSWTSASTNSQLLNSSFSIDMKHFLLFQNYCALPTKLLLAGACLAWLPACKPVSPPNFELNPDTAHNIIYAKITASIDNVVASFAEWSDTDGTGSAASPDLSLCKLTLSKNQSYDVCLDAITLKQSVSQDILPSGARVNDDAFGPTTNYLGILQRNADLFMVFLSDPNDVLSSAKYNDEQMIWFWSGNVNSISGVGRNMKWIAGNTPKTGTVTITVVRRINRNQGANYGQEIPNLPSALSGIVDLTIPIQVTIQ